MTALTASQLVTYACQIAKCPGFTTQAGDMLNTILEALARENDFDILRTSTSITIPTSLYPSNGVAMPANYLRVKEVFYLVDGEVFYLNQLPLEQFDQLFAGPGISNYPQSFATDPSTTPPTMYFYPPSAYALPATVRYQYLPTPITSPASSSSVPWYPNSNALLKMLAGQMAMFSDDGRFDALTAMGGAEFAKARPLDGDNEGFARSVSLDRRRFPGQAGSLAPTKLTGF